MWAKPAKASRIQCGHQYGLAMKSKANAGPRARVVREMGGRPRQFSDKEG